MTGGSMKDEFLFLLNANMELYLILMNYESIGWRGEAVYKNILPDEYTLFDFCKVYQYDTWKVLEGMKSCLRQSTEIMEDDRKKRKKNFYNDSVFDDISRYDGHNWNIGQHI